MADRAHSAPATVRDVVSAAMEDAGTLVDAAFVQLPPLKPDEHEPAPGYWPGVPPV